jgi:hypothetical protein
MFYFFSNRLVEAFRCSSRQFERCPAGYPVREFFKRSSDAPVRYLHGEQQCDAGRDPGYSHQLAQRLDAQMAPVEQEERPKVASH